MSQAFVIEAEVRQDLGKGASRRLRRTGVVPAILYGGDQPPVSLTLRHDSILHQLDNEAFYSTVLNVNIAGKKEKAVLKDLQRHPFKPLVQHVDLLRVSSKEKLRLNIPLHFEGGDVCPGVKQGGGAISHLLTDVEVSCFPQDLPESIVVDMSAMELGDTIKLTDLVLPEGVELVMLSQGDDHDQGIVSVHTPHVSAEPEEGEGEAEGEAESEGTETPDEGA